MFFQQRNEQGRLDQALGRVAPAQQGFHAADAGLVARAVDAVLRLVMQHELAAFAGAVQVVRQGVPAFGGHAEVAGEQAVGAAALLLGLVHGGVGGLQQGGGIVAVGRIEADADTGADAQRIAVDAEVGGHGVEHALGQGFGIDGSGQLRRRDDELVAAQAGRRITFAQHAAQALRHLFQQAVADEVAEAVIDVLEMVEVEQQQADLGAVAARLGDRLGQAVHQQGAVGQAGQGVVQGQVTYTRLGVLARADVAEGALRHQPVLGRIGSGHDLDAYRGAVGLFPRPFVPLDLAGAAQGVDDGAAALGLKQRHVLNAPAAHGRDIAAQHMAALAVQVDDRAVVAVEHQDAVAGRFEQAAMADLGIVQGDLGLAQRQVGAHPRHQLLDLERLADAVDAAGGEGRHAAVDIGQRGHEDDRDVAAVVARLQAAAGFEAVEVGHHDVEQDQVRPGEADAVEGFEPAQRHQDFVAMAFEVADQDAEIGRVVVDDQDARRGGFENGGHAALLSWAHCSISRRTAGDCQAAARASRRSAKP